MSIAGQWSTLGSELPADWQHADLRLELRNPARAAEAAALLGPAQPYRVSPTVLQFMVARDGTAPSPENVTRLIRRLDEAGIGAALTVASSARARAQVEPPDTSLAELWRDAVKELPADWSDLLCELELVSTDFVEPAAVLCIQINPRRVGNRAAFRFRVARTTGYGASASMAERCLARCDERGIKGTVGVLHSLSDVKLVGTQGPVWLMSGETV